MLMHKIKIRGTEKRHDAPDVRNFKVQPSVKLRDFLEIAKNVGAIDNDFLRELKQKTRGSRNLEQ
jgi:hypothetical protein